MMISFNIFFTGFTGLIGLLFLPHFPDGNEETQSASEAEWLLLFSHQ